MVPTLSECETPGSRSKCQWAMKPPQQIPGGVLFARAAVWQQPLPQVFVARLQLLAQHSCCWCNLCPVGKQARAQPTWQTLPQHCVELERLCRSGRSRRSGLTGRIVSPREQHSELLRG
jgi:hypothetical protein